jgi:hypothetical protein
LEVDEILREIGRYETTAIYGAHVVAFGLHTALRELYGVSVKCHLVTDPAGNPAEMVGKPVLPARTAGLDPARTLVLIATTELFHEEIRAELRGLGFENVIPIGAREEHLFLSAYFARIGRFPLAGEAASPSADSLSFPPLRDFAVYAVRNCMDKPLRSEPPAPAWLVPIQAGAGLTNERIAVLADDTGENISWKNRQYSETTATYWVWKNAGQAVKGIFHYRRHLLLLPSDIKALSTGEIDAVLPLPYLCPLSVHSHFRRYFPEEVWKVAEEVLEELYPQRYAEILRILRGPHLYAYNLLCARAAVFDAYCAWIFPALLATEERSRAFPTVVDARVLGYIAEALMTLYFLLHEDKLRIRHAEKRIFV